MARYKVTLEYDGTDFFGFQIQKNPEHSTIQGEIQQTLSRLVNRQVKVCPAGRTDSGVHAMGQVIHFDLEKAIDPDGLHRAMNSLLNKAISINRVEEVLENFHARFSAACRKYAYILDNSPIRSALLRNRCFWFPRPIDIQKMKLSIKYFEGKHDFRMFAKGLKDIRNTIRTINQAEIFEWGDTKIPLPAKELSVFLNKKNMLLVYFKGESFLHSQVRLMVGNLLEVGLGKMEPEHIKKMLIPDLSIKSRAIKVPGKGLYMVGVDYP